MPVNCGSLPKQTGTLTEDSPMGAAHDALNLARGQAEQACASEKCDKGTCSYTETKVAGKTWYDPKTKKWTSSQTSSGKCSCVEESSAPCKKEMEQTVVNYGASPMPTSNKAREIARRLAQRGCEVGKCLQSKGATKPNQCVYEETSIEGHTWLDSASGQYVSTQTSTGKCKCEKRWL
jgi:hypothetical protein